MTRAARRREARMAARQPAVVKAPLVDYGAPQSGAIFDSMIVRGALNKGPIGKPTSKQLRRWSRTNPWIRAAINRRRSQISRSPFDIVALDDTSPEVADEVKAQVLNLFRFPNPKKESFATLIEQVVEDTLVLDQGCLEMELSVGRKLGLTRSQSPAVVHLWAVDGATIKVDPEWDGSDEAAPRYFQVDGDGETVAQFTNDELVMVMMNPVSYWPLGLSALEVLAETIEADIRSAEYAAKIVSNASPPGILDLGEGIRPDQVDSFRSYWDAEIAGRSQIAITGGSKGVKWQPLSASAKEMQFMEWQVYLARKICAVFGCQPQDIGITMDVNRAQGEVGQEISNDVGLLPLLKRVEEFLTREVVAKFSPFLRFTFTDIGRESQQQAAAYYAASMPGVGFIRPNNALRERGEEPLEKYGDEVWITTPNGPMPYSLYIAQLEAPPPAAPPPFGAPPPTGAPPAADPKPDVPPAEPAPPDATPANEAEATAGEEAAAPQAPTGKAVSGRKPDPFSVMAFYRRPGGVPLES